ncbi:fibrobacter succinogenes major paralogous domain-containing protein [Flavobacterium psychrophilum]|uniref:fibrobacter succinogenes major paralogous domain-containing protein n=1 Tax=Flavobacterium psychrophilum TaxID=96345 RepID=UPI000B7C30D4
MKKIKLFLVATIAIIAMLATSCSKSDDNSNQIQPSPITTTISDVDGNTYNTITIGNQVWMKENLNVSKYRNGDIIPQVQDPNQWSNLTTGAWCYYTNQSSYGLVYGKLYNWYAVNDSRGLAPQGWHIPNNDEWNLLNAFLETTSLSGGKLKESGTAHWLSPNAGATNESNFTGLPSGYRVNVGGFENIGKECYWWSSKQPATYTSEASNYQLTYNYAYFLNRYYYKEYGFSVRCIKD